MDWVMIIDVQSDSESKSIYFYHWTQIECVHWFIYSLYYNTIINDSIEKDIEIVENGEMDIKNELISIEWKYYEWWYECE